MHNLQYAYFETAAGLLEIGTAEGAVFLLHFTAQQHFSQQETALARQAADEVREYLAGMRRDFSVPFVIAGTAFRQACYRAAAAIPYGETRSYGEIAAAAGNPRAARAVGRAMAENPVWLLVPCHRVICSGGALGGYAGETELKRRLLELERR